MRNPLRLSSVVLLLLLSAAALTIVLLWPHTNASSKVLIGPATSHTQQDPQPFGSFYRRYRPSDAAALASLHLYWVGPTLGPLVAYVHNEPGADDRGVVVYAPPGNPNQTVVVIASLGTNGKLDVGGRDMLHRLRRAGKQVTISGAAAGYLTPDHLLIAIDPVTVVDLSRLYSLPGLPSITQIAERLTQLK